MWNSIARSMGLVAALAAGASGQRMEQVESLETARSDTVALGHSAAIGAGFAFLGTMSDGRIHLFGASDGGWSEAGVVTSDRWSAKGLGFSMDLDGTTLVVGAPYPFMCDPSDGPSSSGEVVVFRVVGGGLAEAQTLHHDGADRLDRFGEAVAISGDLLVAGAKYDNEAGHSAGAAYLFRNVGGVWRQEAKLIGDQTDEGDILGWSVAVDGERVVLGAPFRSDDGRLHSGGVLVFEPVGGVWRQVARLVSPSPSQHDYFGVAVAVEGDAVLVGATGSENVYAFERGSGGAWAHAATLEKGLGFDIGNDFDFGARVVLEDGVASVAAPRFKQGQVNLYDAADWTLVQKILPDGLARGVQFGSALAVSGDRMLVGARFQGDHGCGMLYAAAGCAPDLTADGVVDTRDFVVFLGMWSAGDADWDGTGATDTADFIAYLADWAAGC
jgi:hypothetical protein